ncbi:MRE11 [Candida jiufengensis]|uniref:MRE11 n=1 Tax=Candida jiufengensis TaxID=497108 RepID=UPI002224CCE4|nr:MRE11 [Candida jiufengensis]KAI5950160.1 MRE11 [Candida jiufengensis]
MPLVDQIEDGEDTIRILLTTDNHVGYSENDPIRGDDSWKTFEEITEIAKNSNIDMMIQGGDLFHINKPSKKSMYHVMKSLRNNCMGDKPCQLELLSDPKFCLSNGFDDVNYEDPNLNISVPVFAISGNHDDATGDGLLSALDVLAVSGLVNYFGKVKDTESITVKPILLQKGRTKLALYGMSNVRDERLHRLFRDGGVKFERPSIDMNDWFNLFVIHQNHAMHTFKSSIPENFLPHFLDFILWGHEHECIHHPVHNPETSFDVLQAGSSIATSLSEGEVADKKVFILKIKGNDYSIESIELKTVRPFVLSEISLSRTDLIPGAASKADVIAFLVDEVEKAIEKANLSYKRSHPDLTEDSEIPLPLIRLRVEYSGGYEIENVRRFSNQFVGKIANVNDVVQFYKKKTVGTTAIKKTKFHYDENPEDTPEEKKELQLSDIIQGFLKQADMVLIPQLGIDNAVQGFLKDDKSSLTSFIKKETSTAAEKLKSVDLAEDDAAENDDSKMKMKHLLAQLRTSSSEPLTNESITTKPKTNRKQQSQKPAKRSKTKVIEILSSNEEEDNDDDDDDDEAMLSSDEYNPRVDRGRGRGRGRGRRRGN